MSHHDDDFEPVPGLPETLPQGEQMLWQGSPQWWSLALRAFRLREVGVYFALLMVWRLVSALMAGSSAFAALEHAADLLPLALAAGAILTGIAYLSARTTIYTITNQRIVMRYGMAVPLVLNIPFSRIESAAAGAHREGTGSIPMKLRKGERIAYLVLWPHARPGYYSSPEPMLRCLPDAEKAASVLRRALEAYNGASAAARPDARPQRAPETHAAGAGTLGFARSAS
ncbi:MAG: photosynthetic complex putative assembly protein PuhB [Beijerinckiaceae bacterium]